MKILNTKTHAILDYAVGILLIATPWILNFADGGPAHMVPVTIGILTIIMSLFTKYEFSIFKLIGMNTHLVIDLLAGVFLAASPWILNFSDQVYLPHLIVGIIETLVVLISETKPFISANEQSFGNPHVRKI
jgi:membrane-bound metal-dependent hydrolase YbcI (DUF457 family)